MRTRVCITIDTEFSIGGAFSDPSRFPLAEPLVWCNVNGRSEGLGFMLETFRQHDVQATFFVETVQRYHFRHDPMRPIVQRIRDEGHEIQLHTHPCWSVFQYEDWRERVRTLRRQDDFRGRSVEDSMRLLQQGIDTFRDWGLPRPTAFRSGNLQHDANLYKALAGAGIPYASNVAHAIYSSGDPQFELYSGVHARDGVLECPVLTFADWHIAGRRHLKSLTIAGTSFAETRRLLDAAHDNRIPLVVILTHPFEYIQKHDIGFRHIRRHAQTQQRLQKLCAFLAGNRDRFDACGMAQAAAALPASDRNVLLEGTLWQSLPRMAAQVAYSKYGAWELARTQGRAT